jgi:SAM-dependent methyltransferase
VTLEPAQMDPAHLDARLYDLRSIGWPGELEFYRELAVGGRVLEIAAGTGRVSLALADAGVEVVGVDVSEAMLEVARSRSQDATNPRWVVGDMRTFDLGEVFDAAIVPAHSFQFMLTPDDQVAALERIRSHLVPSGRLAIHLDHDPPAGLAAMDGTERTGRPITDPSTGRHYRPVFTWRYDHARQDATLDWAWSERDAEDREIACHALRPMVLHVPTANEIEHALRRAGFGELAVTGDFVGSPLRHESPDMVWTATAG